MPLALRGIQLAAATKKIFKIVKYSGVVIYVLLAICLGLIFYFSFKTYSTNNEAKYDSLKSVQNALTFILAVFEVISGFLLLFAVYKIRKYLKKGLKSSQINECNIALHAVCFGLFTLGVIVD